MGLWFYCKALDRPACPPHFPHTLPTLAEPPVLTQRCNYETYVLKPLDINPTSCTERNTHGRSLEDVKALAEQWEEPPALFTLLDFGPMLGEEGGWEGVEKVWNGVYAGGGQVWRGGGWCRRKSHKAVAASGRCERSTTHADG